MPAGKPSVTSGLAAVSIGWVCTVPGLHPPSECCHELPERRQAEEMQGGRERQHGAGLGPSVISVPVPFYTALVQAVHSSPVLPSSWAEGAYLSSHLSPCV